MSKKTFFEPVSAKPDFVELEKKLLGWWYKKGIVKKYLQKNAKSKKIFFFLDGPITANNPMAVHHAWGRTYKDLWQRYFNMKGYKERFKNGFDNQGLWVEVEVEKELGFKNKKDIEKYGIEKFVNKCKERTLKFAQVQTEQSKRLGYFMDWDNSYYTMSDENNYMIWYFLKNCFKKNLLYKGQDTVPWCPRCGTAISQHEILTEEYKEVTHKAVFFKYPVRGQAKTYFLVWTTSPWTIPADIALAVNPELTYATFKNKQTGEKLIFLKDLANKVLDKDNSWIKTEEYQGKKLAGLFYEGIFDDLPVNKKIMSQPKYHIVFLEKELVTAEEGTGIVHISPGSGPEDYQLAKREGLPATPVVDEEGKYLEGYGFLTGENAKNNPDLIFDYLKNRQRGKFFYRIENYLHRYPVCWRCKTELIWRMVEEWYIKMDPLREPMKKITRKITWIPAWGENQELDWLKNMHDWLISKKRYWGLALPIWECQKCGHFEVIGSKEELQKKAVKGFEKFAGHSPHRPWIDEVKIRCLKCKGLMSRIPDVGNPWLDAGIVSFSTLIDPKSKKVSYLTDKKYWQEWFPADFVTECFPGQFKNWFYSLIAMAAVLENKLPFKNLLGHALVKDEKGEEMHKSKGNAIAFDEAADKIGVDVMRWMYVTQNPEIVLNFGYHVADETRRRFHLMLWNIYKFFVTYANVDKFKVQSLSLKVKNTLDKWIISRLNELILEVTGALDNYDALTAAQAIEKFVGDLSTWYLRRSRDRVGPAAKKTEGKKAFYLTFYEVLVTLSKLLAPFVTFLSEEMYRNLTGKESVHLEDWPKAGKVDIKLLTEMEQVRKICELGHAARKEAGIKVRQPLNQFSIFNFQFSIDDQMIKLIKDELNVKQVIIKPGTGDLKVKLDTKITPELKAEGQARELVRQIQELRKKSGYQLDQEIMVYGPNLPKSGKWRDYLKKETLATKLLSGKTLKVVPI